MCAPKFVDIHVCTCAYIEAYTHVYTPCVCVYIIKNNPYSSSHKLGLYYLKKNWGWFNLWILLPAWKRLGNKSMSYFHSSVVWKYLVIIKYSLLWDKQCRDTSRHHRQCRSGYFQLPLYLLTWMCACQQQPFHHAAPGAVAPVAPTSYATDQDQ